MADEGRVERGTGETEDTARARPPRPARRRRRGRGLLIALGVLVALVIVGRLVLDPLAAWGTRRALAGNPSFAASFSGVHVALLPPSYEVHQLKVIEKPDGRWDEPLFYVERARAGVLWRELLRGHVVGQVRLERPKAVAVRKHEKKAEKGGDIAKDAEEMFPLKLDRLEVVDGEALIGIGKGRRAPQLWLHDLDLVAENMATRKALLEGEASRLRLRGQIQRSGKLRVDADMDPFAKQLTFASKAALEGLKVEELHAFLASKSDLQPESGVVNVYAEVRAKDGVLAGGVKPILENLEIRSEGKGLGDRLKAALADAGVELLSDDVPGRDAVATTIPIRGRVDSPDAQLVPTILGAVRNAFVVGLRAGFSNLPPREADKKEGPIKQAWDALTKDEPPEAQPDEDGKAREQRRQGAARRPPRRAADR